MADDRTRDAAFALHRFGLGPRPGSIAALASDPRGALLAELDRPGVGRIDNPDLMTSAQSSRAGFEARAARNAQRVVAERAKKEAERMAAQGEGMSAEAGKMADPAKPAEPAVPQQAQQTPTPERLNFLKEVKARLDAALLAEIGFAERLVWFWSNHFCVSTFVVPNMAGGYEREAIRPHILGRFADLLLAAEGHPAMLIYLDNEVSIGPNSVAGINRTRGLNENLAREILELHTLGVRTGYTQVDVLTFAKVLTGWTIIPPNDNPEHGAEFIFNKRMHEPGPQRVIDKTYADTGVEQGRAVLADLARYPATATHVATKLVRYFIADEPPPPLVERLTKTFRDTDGDLKEVAKALVDVRRGLVRSARQAQDGRRMGHRDGARGAARAPPIPSALARPGGARRAGLAAACAAGLSRQRSGLDRRHGPAARHRQQLRRPLAEHRPRRHVLDTRSDRSPRPTTRQAVARAESRQQALMLAFMAPEFQRR